MHFLDYLAVFVCYLAGIILMGVVLYATACGIDYVLQRRRDNPTGTWTALAFGSTLILWAVRRLFF